MISDFKNFIETHTANEPLFKNKKLLYNGDWRDKCQRLWEEIYLKL